MTTKETKTEATAKSFMKWYKIVAGLERNKWADNCQLCQVYHDDIIICTTEDKFICPIFQYSGQHSCSGSPFMGFCAHSDLVGEVKSKEALYHAVRMMFHVLYAGLEADWDRKARSIWSM